MFQYEFTELKIDDTEKFDRFNKCGALDLISCL